MPTDPFVFVLVTLLMIFPLPILLLLLWINYRILQVEIKIHTISSSLLHITRKLEKKL